MNITEKAETEQTNAALASDARFQFAEVEDVHILPHKALETIRRLAAALDAQAKADAAQQAEPPTPTAEDISQAILAEPVPSNCTMPGHVGCTMLWADEQWWVTHRPAEPVEAPGADAYVRTEGSALRRLGAVTANPLRRQGPAAEPEPSA